MEPPKRILPIIIISQFSGGSLWFAGNAVIADIQREWHLPDSTLGWITSTVQLGFIIGTFLFALLSIVDRYSSRLIFLLSSLLGATANLCILFLDGNLALLLIFRFFTGFFLAGIYPVGMKIAADWYQKGLGKALGYLVGALVLGTAFPHLVRGLFEQIEWENVMMTVSVIASLGGILMYLFVPEGPYSKKSPEFSLNSVFRVFKVKDFRKAAFGYFGHMWELYALWTFIPFILITYADYNSASINISWLAFVIIGTGALGCIFGGYASKKFGSAKIAFVFLAISGLCCFISPFLFILPLPVFIFILIIWGFSVAGDSPQFSTLNALTAPLGLVGTSLTMVTSIGFAVTIVSIETLNYFREILSPSLLFLLLIPGPIFGLFSIATLTKKTNPVPGAG